jgi:hypothetical protein
MKKYKFSLPFGAEEIRIIGKSVGLEWDQNKSGQELYTALRELPIGTFESLEIEIISNVLYNRYNLTQLKKMGDFLVNSKEMSLENDSYFDSVEKSLVSYIKLISLRGMSMKKGLEKAIETRKKDKEITPETQIELDFHNI